MCVRHPIRQLALRILQKGWSSFAMKALIMHGLDTSYRFPLVLIILSGFLTSPVTLGLSKPCYSVSNLYCSSNGILAIVPYLAQTDQSTYSIRGQ